MSAYDILFRLVVSHRYFRDPASCRLRFEPDPATREWLARCGCISRPATNSLTVYCEPPARRPLDELPVTLAYTVSALDPAFGLYSAGLAAADGLAPGSPPGLVFDSVTARLADAKASVWRMTAAPTAAVTARLDGRPDFAVRIGLGADPLLIGQTYEIQLDSRAAIWKYLLIGDWAGQRPCVAVGGRARPDLFADPFADPQAAPDVERLADGRTAVAVRSVTPMPLNDRPTSQLQLWSRRDDGALDRMVATLPQPTPANFALETPGVASTLVAEIYVPR